MSSARWKNMKINIQKLITSLYTSIEESENEVKKTLLFTITSKIIKFSVIHLTKQKTTLKTAERNL